MAIAVNEQSDEIKALAKEWLLLDALTGGTPAMRAAGATFLPAAPREESDSHAARLSVATLFPAYRRTVSVMAGKPFAKALTLTDAAPTIEAWAEDVDLQGVNLHSFASEMFEESFNGLAGIMVDYPRVGPAPQGVRTLATVEAAGLRPYMVRIMHSQILGWRTGEIAGRTTLTQLRIAETGEVEDGPYGTKQVPRVRVLRPGSWELWEQAGARTAWVMIDQGFTSLPVIPFVPVYGHRRGYMDGAPALLDLAYLNVKHWQSQSDQDNIERVARVPILVFTGAEADNELIVGASSAVKLPMGADLKFVEHTGAAIGAGAEGLNRLQEQMIETGAELLVQKPGQRTATEAANDAEANKSDLQRMVEQFEDALDQALIFMAAYGNVPVQQAGSVSLFKDFAVSSLSDASATLVADLNSRGLLTKETTLREMQRRGVLEASVDVEDEIAKAADEGPALGMVGDSAGGVPGDPAQAA